MKDNIKNIFFSWQSVFAVTLVIMFFSFIPVDSVYEPVIPFFDKIVHVFFYITLSFIAVNAFSFRYKGKARFFSFSYSFAVGCFVEIVQIYLPYRGFEFSDIAANTLGALTGILIKIL